MSPLAAVLIEKENGNNENYVHSNRLLFFNGVIWKNRLVFENL